MFRVSTCLVCPVMQIISPAKHALEGLIMQPYNVLHDCVAADAWGTLAHGLVSL